MKLLLVIDMQNDFISGSLGTKEAQKIVDKTSSKILSYEGAIVYTQDTHSKDYLNTMEGKKLPIEHCIEQTEGWEILNNIYFPKLKNYAFTFKKESFGGIRLPVLILNHFGIGMNIEEIELCGVCTDICVISNALILKAAFPETEIVVDASCCAGTTPEKHKAALEVMKSCQINVIGE